jgi:uncharacterized repeat protein (TIGR03803 family)
MLRILFCLFALLMVGVALAPKHARAQSYTESELFNLDNPNGTFIQAADGYMYGTSEAGGNDSYGNIFKFSVANPQNVTQIASFCAASSSCLLSALPSGALIQGTDGNFYGTTAEGGTNDDGAVYRVTSAGTLTTLYSFCNEAACADGYKPVAGLVQGSDGNLYGTTEFGGTCYDCGTIFKIVPSGKMTTIYNFCSATNPDGNCLDGNEPAAGLVQGLDGDYYGTTSTGGTSTGCDGGCGTVFKITPAGTLTTLYNFCSQANCSDGSDPVAGLIQASDGNFYGTTYGDLQSQAGGSIFKITPSGSLTTLYDFCSEVECLDGGYPAAALVLGTDGNFYGTTQEGGNQNALCSTHGCGTVFVMTPAGAVTLLEQFVLSGASGANPQTGLLQANDGNFYGNTFSGANGVKIGAAFAIGVSPALKAPVQVSLSNSTSNLGDSVTLNWKVLNAYSTTLRQCYAFGAAGGGAWSGLQAGSVTGGVYQGSTTIKPTVTGIHNYALTCGGVESGVAALNAGPVTTTTLVTNSPVIIGNVVSLMATVATQLDTAPISGSVAFTVGGTSLGTIPLNSSDSASLTFETSSLALGTYPVTATYSGSSSYLGSSATANVVVEGYPTTTTLSITPATVTQSQAITLSSGVSRQYSTVIPTGKVTFSVGAMVLGSATLSRGTASLTIPTGATTPLGTYAVTATYSGDATDAQSSSAAVDATVLAATVTTLTVTPTTVNSDQTVTFTAKVGRSLSSGTPAGVVNFYGGEDLLGSATLQAGIASIAFVNNGSLPVGSYPITAEYQGDGTDAFSESAYVTLTVEPPGYVTETSLAISPSVVAQGRALELSSTVIRYGQAGTPTGNVAFYFGATSIGSSPLVNGTATLSVTVPTTVTPGTYAVTAKYGGDASDQSSTSSAKSVIVQAVTTTALSADPNPVPADEEVTFMATITEKYGSGVPTGSVTFTTGGTTVGSAPLNGSGVASLSFSDFGIAAGTYPVTATYSGDTNNEVSSATVNLVIK